MEWGDLIRQIVFGIVIGVLPAILWLWFWLKEDKKNPEPKGRLVLTFLGGALAVLVVLPFEELALNNISDTWTLFVIWAGIEEVVKFAFAYFIALSRKECDEAIDPMIYLITTALGFSALENAFFVVSSLTESGISAGFSTANLRFIGATLLHILSSGTIGFFMALAFYRKKISRNIFLTVGILLSIIIHAYFNLNIKDGGGLHTIVVFFVVWVAVILLLLAFEKAKCIKKPQGDGCVPES